MLQRNKNMPFNHSNRNRDSSVAYFGPSTQNPSNFFPHKVNAVVWKDSCLVKIFPSETLNSAQIPCPGYEVSVRGFDCQCCLTIFDRRYSEWSVGKDITLTD